MTREKRTADLKIYSTPSVEKTLMELAQEEGRSFSAYCHRVLEEHVAMKIFKQTISGAGRTN